MMIESSEDMLWRLSCEDEETKTMTNDKPKTLDEIRDEAAKEFVVEYFDLKERDHIYTDVGEYKAVQFGFNAGVTASESRQAKKDEAVKGLVDALKFANKTLDVLRVIRAGLDKGISTVPTSNPHRNAEFWLTRFDKYYDETLAAYEESLK